MVEVHLDDIYFILVDDDFKPCDLYRWVKDVTVFEVLLSSLASQAFTEGECNYSDKTPLNFSYFKVSEFF